MTWLIDEPEGPDLTELAEIFWYAWSVLQRERDEYCPNHLMRDDGKLTLCGISPGIYWQFNWADSSWAVTCKRCRASLKAKAAAL